MRRTIPFVACLIAISGIAFAADEAPTDRLNKPIDNFTLKDASGKSVSLQGLKGNKAVVVVFLSFDCPVSKGYSSTLADLHAKYASKGVAFVGVCANADIDATTLAKSAAEFKLPFPVVKDDGYVATDALKAAVSPEAFILDSGFVLRYRGRIDNTYAARLKKNNNTTTHDLAMALDEVLAGKSVSTPATKAVGCPIIRESVAKKEGTVTYHRDVLPILQNNCQSCHRKGEVGPFALTTYKQAVTWSSDIKDYTQSRKMPPWKPTEGLAYHNERKMSAKDIETIARWVDAGTPEGDPKDAPPAKVFTDGWQLGTPDLVLETGDMTIGATGRDLFHCFVMPTKLGEDKYVTAIEVRPGNPRVVHHTLNFIDTTGRARQLEKAEQEKKKSDDDKDHGPGYTVAMGVGFLPRAGLGGWAPGQIGRYLPEGTGYVLPKDSDVVVQVHYHRTGKVETANTKIGLYFAKKPLDRPFQSMVIRGQFFVIPAKVERHKVDGGIEVEQDCTLYSVMPHMHMLGKEIKVTLTPPSGEKQTLIAIKDWDYNWQETYFLKEPLKVKAGTKLSVEAIYDNSAKNPQNPFSPPRAVLFGEQTTNEMCFIFLGATSDKPGRIRIKQEGRAAALRGE